MFMLTLAAAVASGIVAGVFFTFSNFVMTALGRMRAERGAEAMREINVAVQNPVFFVVFFGTGAASLVLIVLAAMHYDQLGSAFVALGSLFYLAGSIGVTLRRNVPLNDALDAAEATPHPNVVWSRYQTDWVYWNHVRALATGAAAVMFSAALALL